MRRSITCPQCKRCGYYVGGVSPSAEYDLVKDVTGDGIASIRFWKIAECDPASPFVFGRPGENWCFGVLPGTPVSLRGDVFLILVRPSLLKMPEAWPKSNYLRRHREGCGRFA